MPTHDDVACRWVKRAMHGQQSARALNHNNIHDEGDKIYSYGHHFELARALYDNKRQFRGFLLNGNTWIGDNGRPGVVTRRHQNAVRSAVGSTGYPSVTIPYEALEAAGIDLDTVQELHVQADWNTTTVIERQEMPGKWEYESRYEAGGWINSRTGEFVQREGWGYGNKPKQETCAGCENWIGYSPRNETWEDYSARAEVRETHIRLRHGEWEDVQGRTINNGRKTVHTSRHVDWDIVDAPDSPTGVVYMREVQRHWLGASLIRAAVPYPIRRTCKICSGTGRVEPYAIILRNEAEGPMDEDTAEANRQHVEYQRSSLRRNEGYYDDGEWRTDEPIQHWKVNGSTVDDRCKGCSRRGWNPGTRNRWAYFLSGFDANETRPSYFFCELPPGVHPTTVEEALETLKPDSVKLAESMGREVKRQGDIFCIPMPEVTLAELKADGGVHRKRATELEEREVQRGRRWSRTWETINVRVSERQALILDTNHEATEVVDMPNGQTYVRGALTHEPGDRPRDHARLSLGKTWHLAVKNTVPIGV